MEDAPDLPKPGEVLAGKYEVVRLLGRGGMGAVFEAKHLRLHQRVAIKFLKPDLLAHADCVTRFEREGRAAARMTSTNAARIYDVDITATGIPYMVIEFLEGHDLSVELRERETLPVSEAVDIVLQACSAMAEAHALGVVHRDLKPANLFLCTKGSGRTVKVLDFGVSKILADEMPQTTTPSLTLGTPQYMSPEQILASRDVDLQSDIWSLGVILYKLMSGRLPFEAESATAFVVTVVTNEPVPILQHTAVPPELATAVMTALEKTRAKRWQTVEDFARSIQPFGTGRVGFTPSSVRPPSNPKVPNVDVPIDFEMRTVTALPSSPSVASVAARSSSTGEAAPTEANWTHNPTFPLRRRRRIGVAIASGVAIVGLLSVGVGLAWHKSEPGAATASAATVTPPQVEAPSLPTEIVPAPPTTSPQAPATTTPSAKADAPTKPVTSHLATTSPTPHKSSSTSATPVTPAIPTTTAAPASTSRPAHQSPNPVNDPVHL